MRVLLLALYLALVPCVVSAQEPVPDVQAHVIDGKSYVCFVTADAQTLLQLRIDCPKLQLAIDQYRELVTLKNGQITTLTGLNLNLSQQADVYKSEMVRLNEALASANAWYRNPYLWFGVGVVVGTGASIAIFYAVK